MRKHRTKWLDRRVAHPGPYLCLVLSEEEFRDAVRPLRMTTRPAWVQPPADATTYNLNHDEHGLCAIVALRGWEGRDPIEVAGLLVHEAVHVWQAYAEGIGERFPGAEQEAYAVQGIAQELMAEFARRMRS